MAVVAAVAIAAAVVVGCVALRFPLLLRYENCCIFLTFYLISGRQAICFVAVVRHMLQVVAAVNRGGHVMLPVLLLLLLLLLACQKSVGKTYELLLLLPLSVCTCNNDNNSSSSSSDAWHVVQHAVLA